MSLEHIILKNTSKRYSKGVKICAQVRDIIKELCTKELKKKMKRKAFTNLKRKLSVRLDTTYFAKN